MRPSLQWDAATRGDKPLFLSPVTSPERTYLDRSPAQPMHHSTQLSVCLRPAAARIPARPCGGCGSSHSAALRRSCISRGWELQQLVCRAVCRNRSRAGGRQRCATGHLFSRAEAGARGRRRGRDVRLSSISGRSWQRRSQLAAARRRDISPGLAAALQRQRRWRRLSVTGASSLSQLAAAGISHAESWVTLSPVKRAAIAYRHGRRRSVIAGAVSQRRSQPLSDPGGPLLHQQDG